MAAKPTDWQPSPCGCDMGDARCGVGRDDGEAGDGRAAGALPHVVDAGERERRCGRAHNRTAQNTTLGSFASRRTQLRDIVLASYRISRFGGRMQRREFIQAVAVSTVLPPTVRAQQTTPSSRIVKIGVLWQVDSADELLKIYGDALTQTLSGLGYVNGKTAQFLDRSSNNPHRLRELAKELVDEAPDVIFASSHSSAVELKQATTRIPVVFATAPNPVASGLVETLAHPGGNLTGLSLFTIDTSGKRLSLFKEAVPSLRRL